MPSQPKRYPTPNPQCQQPKRKGKFRTTNSSKVDEVPQGAVNLGKCIVYFIINHQKPRAYSKKVAENKYCISDKWFSSQLENFEKFLMTKVIMNAR